MNLFLFCVCTVLDLSSNCATGYVQINQSSYVCHTMVNSVPPNSLVTRLTLLTRRVRNSNLTVFRLQHTASGNNYHVTVDLFMSQWSLFHVSMSQWTLVHVSMSQWTLVHLKKVCRWFQHKVIGLESHVKVCTTPQQL